MIKKRGFWRNALLSQSKTLGMLTYLNRMSAKGLHVTRLGRFKNDFDQNEGERYIYAICSPATEDYYSEVGRWERLFEYKSLVFYRKKLPRNHVSIKKRNLQKKAMKEKLWLSEQLKQGLLLFGKAEDEYIFEHSSETASAEYFVDYIGNGKNPDEYLYEKALAGFECISPSTDGVTYYFIRREGKEVVKGLKKLRTDKELMKRKMLFSLLSLILITAAFITALVFALIYKKLILPCVITGGTLTLASTITFLIFKSSFNREKLRLLKEEAALEQFKKEGVNGFGNVPLPSDNGTLPQHNTQNKTVANTQSQYPVGAQPQFTNGTQYPGGAQPQFPNGTLYPSGAQPQLPFQGYQSVPLPNKSDDSDEWEYVDDTPDDEYSDDSEEGVTFSPNNGTYVQPSNGHTYGQDYGQNGYNRQFSGQAYTPNAYNQQHNGQTNRHNEFSQPSVTVLGQQNNIQAYGNPAPNESDRINEIEAEYQRNRFLIYQLISCITFLLAYTVGSAFAVINCIIRFITEQKGHAALFILGILLTVFLPVVIYNAVGSVRVLCSQIKNRKNKGF